MAIYRPPRPRWPAILAGAILGLLVGVGTGVLLARSDEPDAQAVVNDVRAGLSGAVGLLEVVTVEYEESVADTEVRSRPEYEAARRALARSRARYEEAGEVMRALVPRVASRIDDTYDELERLVNAPAPVERVEQLVRRLIDLLDDDAGG